MERTTTPPNVHIWLGTWEGGRFLLPIAATVAGAWGFARPSGGELAAVALAAALVLVAWMPLWRALTATNWAHELHGWRAWREVAPLPRWPYLQPSAPGARLYRSLGLFRAWWQREGAGRLAFALSSALLALLVSLLLGLALNRNAVLLSLLFLTWAELVTLWNEGRGDVGSGGEAVALVGLPWLLGSAVAGEILPEAVLAALVVTLVVAPLLRPGWTALVGPVIGALFLVLQGAAVAAGVLLLLAFPPLLFTLRGAPRATYRRAVAPWLLAILLLFAGVVA